MKYANLYFLIPVFLFSCCSAIIASYAFAAQGIFPIGTDAVYILNEACTVNMTPQRSEEDILADMVECISLHRQHR